MANIVRTNNTNNAVNNGPYNNSAVPSATGTANSLRDVCNFLQPAMGLQALPPGACPYDRIIELMRGLDLQDDGIVMNHKIKSIEMEFCNIVRDENMLSESMEYINDVALNDGDTSLKFALLFSSRNFDSLALNETKVRYIMLTILETNYQNADTYRVQNRDRLYNSITLLGEYFYRVRLAGNSTIRILGKSLITLLIKEISEQEVINIKLAKLILSQITLNGDLLREKHKPELTQLLFHIRRNLIEQPSLKASVKALLLMTLDLYYSNFTNLGTQLEVMYTKYLVQEDEDEGNNNLIQQEVPQSPPTHQQQYQEQQPQQQQQVLTPTKQSPKSQQSPLQDQKTCVEPDNSFENGKSDGAADDSYEFTPLTKKWSEQVSEDSLYENDFGNDLNCDTELNSSGGNKQENLNTSLGDQSEKALSSSSRCDNERDSSSRNSRRSHNRHRKSPRPLKQNSITVDNTEDNHQQSGEERDQTKPLPRWRAPRFNRENTEQDSRIGGPRNQTRRFSGSYDDDRQSVRSEGGSIRLYSINDRLKHSQEKMERDNGNIYNSIANSNWDRQSQRDDRSERSYISNYERGNHRRGGRNHNRQTYDKPPRFQKTQQQQQESQRQQSKNNDQIKSDTWRRSNTNSTSSYQDENNSYPSNGPESNSRSSSRARTLPRPAKSNIDGNSSSSYRRSSQSPTHPASFNQQAGRNSGRNQNSRYSSQSSLASEASSTLGRRRNRNNRNFDRRSQESSRQSWGDTRSVHGQPEETSWDSKDNNSELVRNARNTTKYMNYLSSKK